MTTATLTVTQQLVEIEQGIVLLQVQCKPPSEPHERIAAGLEAIGVLVANAKRTVNFIQAEVHAAADRL